ncbi:MAG: amphi-Trp domain-containing protein [Acidimicrobiia bacterium]|nr:amphi-Trp domain-containing protein [Acidimicrobiia bacterium]
MDLIEHEHSENMRREAAAEKLREIADMLSRHNEIRFELKGISTSVDVPNEVEFSFEVEVGSDGSEIEIEISW